MRSFIIALLILVILIISMFFYYNLLNDLNDKMQGMITSLEKEVEKHNWEEASKTAEKIDKEWEKNTKWLSCLIEHNEVDNIMITVASVKEFTHHREEPELKSEISKLEKLMNHIPKKESLILENLF